MKKIIVPIVLFLVIPCFCFAQRTDSSAIVSALTSVLMKQKEAWNKGDIAGYMDGYWKSDSLVFTSGGNIQRGWKATYEKYSTSYNTKEKMGVLNFSQLEFTLLSDNSAWALGHWELTRKEDHPQGIFTLVMRKFSDGWKVVHDHTSVITPKK